MRDNRINCSIAMAVYNGATYLKEQIESILPQLIDGDELVISYDKSSDNTWDIINAYASNDSRIKIVENPDSGCSSNFTNAIKACSKEYLFFSDQDDVWSEGKIESILEHFEIDSSLDFVVHNCVYTDPNLIPLTEKTCFEERGRSLAFWSNFYKNKILGCCMCCKTAQIKQMLPISNYVLWDGHISRLLILKKRKGLLDDRVFLLHRRLPTSLTLKRRPLKAIVIDRILSAWFLLVGMLTLSIKKDY